MEDLQPPAGIAVALPQETASPEAIEQWLVAQFAASCDVPEEEIEVDAPLTSFGLESLTLFTIAGDLASWLDRDIPATVLWEYPTIQEVAAYLCEGEPAQPEEAPPIRRGNPLVTIQPKGDLPPLFLVHDLCGGLWCYTAMMRYMDARQPVYGFQIPVVENESFEVPPMEELAAFYVDALRRQHPQGPYRLAGFSMGGVVAYEMARQLTEAGQEVAFVGMIDSNFPTLEHRAPPPLHRPLRHLRNLWPLGAREKALYILEQTVPHVVRSFYFHTRHLEPLGRGEKLRYFRHLLIRKPGAPSLGNASEQQRFRELLFNSNMRDQLERITREYRPLPFDGSVTLLRARWQLTLDDDSREWRRVALKGIQQKFSSGWHSIVVNEPHVRELAANITESLREVQHR